MSGIELKPLLQKIAAGTHLDDDEMFGALSSMTEGGATPAQMGAFLMGLRIRGESVAEIAGAARLLRQKMIAITAPAGAVDIVGTGGDGLATHNISTCAAFVAAGAGLKVAKHGNRSISSLSGASDVLTALGVDIDVGLDTLSKTLEAAGVCFLWAPKHHTAMKAWAPIRAELGVRTIFNLLGPLCNPAAVKHHVIGVYDQRWVEPVAEVLKTLGSLRAWVVHSHDGMDELSTTGPTAVAELSNGAIAVFDINPQDAGLPPAKLSDLRGGDAETNARALRQVLDGERGAYRDIVLLNAAAALVVCEHCANIADGVQRAAEAIDCGAARQALDTLVAVTSGKRAT